MKKHLFFIFICITLLLISVKVLHLTPDPNYQVSAISSVQQFWPYECIDTMKTSRDNARNWANIPNLKDLISKEMEEIKKIGANCVAIDTPYDSEFLPFLTIWVNGARNNNLHIWFRGNLSGWEQWFNYDKLSDENNLLSEINTFINQNSDLFKDGDIFTYAPEAENGGPFNQVSPAEYPRYKAFLQNEYSTCLTSFLKLKKNVVCNWLSMNGGLAQRMFDQKTVNNIGKVVTIDHYIKTPEEMNQYINTLSSDFGAKIVIGEFGAPIPEINGSMTENEQARFVDSLMQQMYKNKDKMEGVNYWTLYSGSTAILNEDYSQRQVANIIANYYRPGVIYGKVQDSKGIPIIGAKLTTSDGYNTADSNSSGNFQILVPANQTANITAEKNNYNSQNTSFYPKQNEIINYNFTLKSKENGLSKLKDYFLKLFSFITFR
jgi:hypothetical protein